MRGNCRRRLVQSKNLKGRLCLRLDFGRDDRMMRADPPSSLSFRRPRLDERVHALTAEIEQNIANRTKFDASTPPHRELTEALHRGACDSPTQKEPRNLLIR